MGRYFVLIVVGNDMKLTKENIRIIFEYMELDSLTDSELNLLISFEEQFKRKGILSETQFEILLDINRKAGER